MLGTWSMAASMPAIDGSAAPRMSFTLRARLPRASSAIAWSSATIAAQSSCGPDEGADGGGVVGAVGGLVIGITGTLGGVGTCMAGIVGMVAVAAVCWMTGICDVAGSAG